MFQIFFCLITISSIKIIYLSLYPEKIYLTQENKENFIKERRDIIDRNGTVIATNVTLYNVGIRPKLLNQKEKKNLIIKLKLLFPELDSQKIKAKLDKITK